MDIADWRQRIDELNRDILELLNRRAECVLGIAELKKARLLPVYDPEREKQVFEELERINRGPMPNESVRRVFESIISESRRLEEDHLK